MIHLSFWAWLVVAVVCAAYEIVGAQMLSLPFGLGALAAAIATLLGGSSVWQWALFFSVTFVALLGFDRLRRASQQQAPPDAAEGHGL